MDTFVQYELAPTGPDRDEPPAVPWLAGASPRPRRACIVAGTSLKGPAIDISF